MRTAQISFLSDGQFTDWGKAGRISRSDRLVKFISSPPR